MKERFDLWGGKVELGADLLVAPALEFAQKQCVAVMTGKLVQQGANPARILFALHDLAGIIHHRPKS
ncbi:MAG: hypothetical protein NVSMB57_07280 [Actinomycetota bacterium]